MIARARRRARGESGAVLVVVAVSLVALLGFAALAIDVGSFYQAQRQAQSAADAGALAGADDIITSPSAVLGDATTYASTNAPSTTPTIAANQPTSASVRVSVGANAPAFFGRLLGVTSAKVSATATAAVINKASHCAATTGACDAIFAMSTSCTTSPSAAVEVTTGQVNINGAVHSNGSFDATGGNDQFGPTEYGSGCPAPSVKSGQSFNGASQPTAAPTIAEWPIDYTLQYPACNSGCTGQAATAGTGVITPLTGTPSYCTQSAQSFSGLTPVTGQVYCAVGTGTASDPTTWNGAISLNAAGTATSPIQSTYIGGSITVGNSANAFLSPCVTVACSSSNKLIFYATTGNISSGGGSSGAINGDMFARAGSITITGGGQTTNFLEGQTVNIQSGGMTGDGPQDVPGQVYVGQTVALIQ